LIGDGTSYSEGAAYGSDQSSKVYSPYSVYGDVSDGIYDPADKEYAGRKKAVIAETRKRVQKLPAYVAKKQWFEVSNELARYMYETRGAVRGLATTPEQKALATAFFKAIEETDIAARRKNGAKAGAAAAAALTSLDAFSASL
jgi:photosystem II oxygen-evolving enhancer protein 3